MSYFYTYIHALFTRTKPQELLEALDTAPEFLEEFDEGWFDELVEYIVVESNETLRFRLKNGLELREKLKRSVR